MLWWQFMYVWVPTIIFMALVSAAGLVSAKLERRARTNRQEKAHIKENSSLTD